MFLFIQDGIAYELIPEFDEALPGIPLNERYSSNFLSQVVEVPDGIDVKLGWQVDTNSWTFTEPLMPEPPEIPAVLHEHEPQFTSDALAELRREIDELRAQVDGMAGAVQEFVNVAAMRG